MVPIIRALTAICFLVLFQGAAADVGATLTTGKITEVSVSSDMRRVTVKTEGIVGNHVESTAANPSRLIIDLAGVTVGKPLAVTGAGKDSSLGIRVAKNDLGARVVMDFGTSPVPGYRVRRLGSYLMVFFQDWTPPITQSQHRTGVDRPAVKEPPPVPGQRIRREEAGSIASHRAPREETHRMPRVKTRSEDISAVLQPVSEAVRPNDGPAELFIRSAEVAGGVIVLHVARRSNPATIYRIDLGVDFSQLGFSAARISPVGSEPTHPIRVATRKSPFWDENSQTPRIGPRKYQPVCAKVDRVRGPSQLPLKLSSR